jgi:hypothetical protein
MNSKLWYRYCFVYVYDRKYLQNNLRRLVMKKIVVIALVLLMGIMIGNPSVSYSRSFDHSRGDYRHAAINNYNRYDRQTPRPYNNVRSVRSKDDNNGLLIAGAALGGIVLGAILISAMSQPGNAPARQAVYSIPSSGSSAYAQPYAYGTSYNQDAPPGQWVTVQGQWVNGQWIPAHNAWVPVNP